MKGLTMNLIFVTTSKLISVILPIVSEHIREGLKELLKNLYEKANETQNPYDDFLLEFIIRLLGLEKEILENKKN